MSILAIKHPCPAFLISLSWMAWSVVLVYPEEIPSLTGDPFGKDRSWINLYSPGVFLGTTPRGETRKGGKRGDSNWPANLCNSVKFLRKFWINHPWVLHGRLKITRTEWFMLTLKVKREALSETWEQKGNSGMEIPIKERTQALNFYWCWKAW